MTPDLMGDAELLAEIERLAAIAGVAEDELAGAPPGSMRALVALEVLGEVREMRRPLHAEAHRRADARIELATADLDGELRQLLDGES